MTCKLSFTQFDLVCSKDGGASLATTLYFVGVMLGGLVFGHMADQIGRRPVLLATFLMSTVLGTVTAFSLNYVMFVSLRFVQGVLMQVRFIKSFDFAIHNTMDIFKINLEQLKQLSRFFFLYDGHCVINIMYDSLLVTFLFEKNIFLSCNGFLSIFIL